MTVSGRPPFTCRARATRVRPAFRRTELRAATPARRLARGATALALVAASPCAVAQQAEDRWWFHLGGYRPTIDSVARSDFVAGDRPGTELRFEDELGLAKRKSLPWFQAGARLGERWRIELEYFALRRDGTRTVSRDISWGDEVFPVNATVSSEFDSDIFRLSAGYSFHRSDSAEFGAVLGLHTTRFRVALATKVSVGQATGGGREEAEDALIPLPTVGLYGNYRFGRNVFATGRVDYFAIGAGEYSGGLVNVQVSVGYRVTDRFGLAAGYRYVDYTVDVDKPRWRGGVDYRFSGPFLALQLGF